MSRAALSRRPNRVLDRAATRAGQRDIGWSDNYRPHMHILLMEDGLRANLDTRYAVMEVQLIDPVPTVARTG